LKLNKELAEQLVGELQDRNGRIETSTLQIICWQVEDKFVPAWIQGDEKFVLTFEQIDIDQDGQIKGDIETVLIIIIKILLKPKLMRPSVKQLIVWLKKYWFKMDKEFLLSITI